MISDMETATIYHVLNLSMGILFGLYGLLESTGLGFVLIGIGSVMIIVGALYQLFSDDGTTKDISPGYLKFQAVVVLLMALSVGLTLL